MVGDFACLLNNFVQNKMENRMEDSMLFDIDGILSDEEAEKFFEETDEEQQEGKETPDEEENDNPAEETEESEQEEQEPESVGEEDETEKEEDAKLSGKGSSPTVLSSIAIALKKDGIFLDFDDEVLAAVKTPEDFAELFEQTIASRVDADTRAVKEAMSNGVEPDTIKKYQQAISELESYTDEAISAEDENGENLRKYLIFNDLLKRGYSEEKARKELKKSFDAQMDIEDAKDALESLKKRFATEYQQIQEDAKKKHEEAKAAQQKQSEDFKKMILEDEIKVGDNKLDKRTCQKVFDAVSKPVYKDPDTGRLLTAVQKFQKEQPLEFLKQLGLWYVLTDGGKNVSAMTKKQLQAEKNKGIRELERKINSSNFSGGSLRYDGGAGSENGDDILLSDDWQIA